MKPLQRIHQRERRERENEQEENQEEAKEAINNWFMQAISNEH